MLTMDKDFGVLVHKLSMQHSGVLLLRMEDAKGAKKAENDNRVYFFGNLQSCKPDTAFFASLTPRFFDTAFFYFWRWQETGDSSLQGWEEKHS